MLTACGFCRGMRLEPAPYHLACPECGRRMLRIAEPDMGGDVLHCPRHCTTLIPPPAMIDAAAGRGDSPSDREPR